MTAAHTEGHEMFRYIVYKFIEGEMESANLAKWDGQGHVCHDAW